jgi:hypothetical protein
MGAPPRRGWHSAPESARPGIAGMEPGAFPVAGNARMASRPGAADGTVKR